MKKSLKYVLLSLLIFAVYYGTAISGLHLGAVSGFATLVWPPTGIALAALFLLGGRYWPAVAAGALAANFVTGAPLLVAIGIAAGNSGEAALGAYLLKRAGFRATVDRVRDAVSYIVLAGLLCTLLSPTVGVTSLLLGGIVTTATYGQTWLVWWIGDILGALVFGSLLIVAMGTVKPKGILKRPGEAVAQLATLVISGLFIFDGPLGIQNISLPIVYIVFIPLLWAALRFGPLGTTISTLVISVIAVWGTVNAHGPFTRGSISESLLYLQLFMGVVAGTMLIVAAEDAERRRAEDELRGFNKGLEKKVAERTGQLSKANEALERSKDLLDKRRAVLQAVLHSIGEGVAAFDADGHPIVINQWAMKMMGIAPADAASPLEKMAEQFPFYYADGQTRVPFGDVPITRALRGEATANERLILKTKGAPNGVLISISGAPIRDERGTVMGGVVVFREVPA